MFNFTCVSTLTFDAQFYSQDSYEAFIKIGNELIDQYVKIKSDGLIDEEVCELMGECEITLISEKGMSYNDLRENADRLIAAINVLNLLEMI